MSSFYGMRIIPSSPRLFASLALALACGAAAPVSAAGNSVAPLPKQRIESVYRNGDIDSVIFYLKQGREKPMFLDRNDSVLAFKYLGIIYASDRDKREKGRYYFNQMLRLDPGASITELLPGEVARNIFREVREEFFELNPGLAAKHEAAPPPAARPEAAPARYNDDADTEALPPAAPLPEPKPKATAEAGPQHGHKVWWWVAGGAVVVGTAAGVAIAVMDPAVQTHAYHD